MKVCLGRISNNSNYNDNTNKKCLLSKASDKPNHELEAVLYHLLIK